MQMNFGQRWQSPDGVLADLAYVLAKIILGDQQLPERLQILVDELSSSA